MQVKRDSFLKILEEPFRECYMLGGEPTINSDFLWTVKELYKRGISTYVYSNSKVSFETIMKSQNYVKYILSYHKEQITLQEFIKNAALFKSIHTIKVMWSEDIDTLQDYKLLKHMFKNTKVFLEPVFDVIDNKMVINNFIEARARDIERYSEILRLPSLFSDKTIGDMFIAKDELKPKMCKIQQTSLTYDYQKMTKHRCLTDCLQGIITTDEICNNTHCLCDIDKVKEFL